MAAGLAVLVNALLGGQLWILLSSLFLYVSMIGFVSPNSTAGALSHQGTHAGAASAVPGTLQYIFGALLSCGISIFDDDSAIPMAAGMAFCGAVSWLSYMFLVRR